MDDFLSLFHWSFFAVGILTAVIVKFLDRVHKKVSTPQWIDVFFPDESENKLKPRFLSALIAMVIAVQPGLPAPDLIGSDLSFAHILYFAVAGIFGAWVLQLVEKVFLDILPTEIKQLIEKLFGTQGDPEDDDSKD